MRRSVSCRVRPAFDAPAMREGRARSQPVFSGHRMSRHDDERRTPNHRQGTKAPIRPTAWWIRARTPKAAGRTPAAFASCAVVVLSGDVEALAIRFGRQDREDEQRQYPEERDETDKDHPVTEVHIVASRASGYPSVRSSARFVGGTPAWASYSTTERHGTRVPIVRRRPRSPSFPGAFRGALHLGRQRIRSHCCGPVPVLQPPAQRPRG